MFFPIEYLNMTFLDNTCFYQFLYSCEKQRCLYLFNSITSAIYLINSVYAQSEIFFPLVVCIESLEKYPQLKTRAIELNPSTKNKVTLWP